jgi:diguanylate cyclase (GGDEF)-like protein
LFLAEPSNMATLETRERLKWAFRFRRRLIIGLLVVYTLAVVGRLVQPLWSVLLFYLFFFGVNELREWLFWHERIDERSSRPTVVIEIFAVSIIIYFSGGVESPLVPLAVLQVMGISTYVGYDLAWICAYVSTALFSAMNVLELSGVLPHSPLLLVGADGGYVSYLATPMGARGAGPAFMYLVVASVAYGVMLSLAAYSSGYINSKMKVREDLLERSARLQASLNKLSAELLGELAVDRAIAILARWLVGDMGNARCMVAVKTGESESRTMTPEAAIPEDELARLIAMRPAGEKPAYYAGWLALPIGLGETTVGWLLVETREEPTPADRDLIETAVNQLRTCLDRATRHADVLAQSILDGMTGVHNHRHFVTALKGELTRARRYQQPLSLLLVDVDHFKKVNDQHGHLAGDAILKGLAQRLKQTVREVDIVARYGGEEFVVVAPQTDLKQAEFFAERLRRKISDDVFPSDGKELKVSVSIGVAETLADQAECEDDLIRIADTRLYRAKEGGRNCVVAA